MPDTDRRIRDIAGHEIIIAEIKGVNKRLDKMNGSIANFEDNKFKRDLAYDNILTNSTEHKGFLSKALVTTIGSILGLILVIHTVIDLFGIRLGG